MNRKKRKSAARFNTIPYHTGRAKSRHRFPVFVGTYSSSKSTWFTQNRLKMNLNRSSWKPELLQKVQYKLQYPKCSIYIHWFLTRETRIHLTILPRPWTWSVDLIKNFRNFPKIFLHLYWHSTGSHKPTNKHSNCTKIILSVG